MKNTIILTQPHRQSKAGSYEVRKIWPINGMIVKNERVLTKDVKSGLSMAVRQTRRRRRGDAAALCVYCGCLYLLPPLSIDDR